MDDDKAGLIQYQNSGIGPRPHQVLIYLNKRSTITEQSITIAHEMVHASQYIRGDLVRISDRSFMWKGRVIDNIHRLRYESRPWEIEAMTLGEHLRKYYLQRNSLHLSTQTDSLKSDDVAAYVQQQKIHSPPWCLMAVIHELKAPL